MKINYNKQRTDNIPMGEKAVHRHFSRIANQYRDLRTTDIEPLLYLKKNLNGSKKIEAADVGCGDGRYSLELFKCLGNRLNLSCIDANPEMLKHLHTNLVSHKIENFQTKKSLCRGPTNRRRLP